MKKCAFIFFQALSIVAVASPQDNRVKAATPASKAVETSVQSEGTFFNRLITPVTAPILLFAPLKNSMEERKPYRTFRHFPGGIVWSYQNRQKIQEVIRRTQTQNEINETVSITGPYLETITFQYVRRGPNLVPTPDERLLMFDIPAPSIPSDYTMHFGRLKLEITARGHLTPGRQEFQFEYGFGFDRMGGSIVRTKTPAEDSLQYFYRSNFISYEASLRALRRNNGDGFQVESFYTNESPNPIDYGAFKVFYDEVNMNYFNMIILSLDSVLSIY